MWAAYRSAISSGTRAISITWCKPLDSASDTRRRWVRFGWTWRTASIPRPLTGMRPAQHIRNFCTGTRRRHSSIPGSFSSSFRLGRRSDMRTATTGTTPDRTLPYGRGCDPSRARRQALLGIAMAVATACMAMAGVVDRVAVVVGNQVITESELLRELRLTEFMNGEPLELTPQKRREAAERLVDQQLIRQEMEIGNYPKPSPQEAEAMLRKFRQEHYPTEAQFRAALEKYGISEDDLKQHLLWQLAAMRFTDQRFHVLTASTPAQSTDGQSADRASKESSVDEQMDAWLKQQRASTRIQFKKGAFAQ